MQYTSNSKLALYESYDQFNITGDTDSLNNNMKIIDNSINTLNNDVTELNNALNEKASKALYDDTTINIGRCPDTTVGKYSTAEGHLTVASGSYSHAEGSGANATGYISHAEGNSTTAIGANSHAGGYMTKAIGDASFAHGYKTNTNNECEVAFGKYNKSNIDTLFSIGDGTSETNSHNAFEITTDGGKLHDKDIATTDMLSNHTGNTSNPHSVTKAQVGLGNVPNVSTNDQTPTYSDTTTFETLTSGEKISVALGKIKLAITNLINHIANKSNPHGVTKSQIGLGNVGNFKAVSTVAGQGLTEDEKANARTNIGVGTSSFSGDYNDLSNKPVVDTALSSTSTNTVQNKVVNSALNNKADKSKYGDTTINVGRKADTTVGTCSTAEGSNTTASGDHSHAEGQSTTASGVSSHAEGSNYKSSGTEVWSDRTVTISDVDYTISSSTAYGTNSHAEGTQSFAYGYSSHAEGRITTASGDGSHAEGVSTTASGNDSHAEGIRTIASGNYSHAEGSDTTASGNDSHAEGFMTTTSGSVSHAEGRITTASGDCSHAGGNSAKAIGDASFAHGYHINANNDNEVAFGKYNKSNINTLFSIGDGTSETDSHNAFEITSVGARVHDQVIVTTKSGFNDIRIEHGSMTFTRITSAKSYTVEFSKPFATLLGVVVSVRDTTGTASSFAVINDKSETGFTVKASYSTGFEWIAIGTDTIENTGIGGGAPVG